MKRLAAHRVLIATTGELLSLQVVVTEGGSVSWHPLAGEEPFTEMLGGLLVVAPCPVRLMPGESFAQFRIRLVAEAARIASSGWEVYWVTPFRVADERLLPGSRCIKLQS